MAFLVVLCSLLVLLCDVFELENTANYAKRLSTYRDLEKNTIDAVIIGTSGTDRYWIGPKAYEKYGMTVYPYSSDAMPGWLYPDVVDEIYTHQNPQLIIADIRPFTQNNTKASLMEVRGRRVLDAMTFLSINRMKTGITVMEQVQPKRKTEPNLDWKVSFFLTFFKYHTKWENEDFSFADNLGEKKHEYMGFFINPGLTVRQSEQTPVSYRSKLYKDLDPTAEAALIDFMDYVEENDINVLFMDTPKLKDEEEMGRTNTIKKMIKARGMDYIDFYKTSNRKKGFVMNLNHKKDFYNSGHVNYYGAEKFTDYFAAYLQENYSFADHRGDEKVKKDWDGIYDKIKSAVATLEKGETLEEVA